MQSAGVTQNTSPEGSAASLPTQAEVCTSLPEVADEVLLQALQSGDASAGETLARRYVEPLMRYLTRLVGASSAEELFQQTWLSVLDHLERFDPAPGGGGFKAWLFRIATNKARDQWRASGRERSAMNGLALISDPAFPDAAQRLEAADDDRLLQGALDKLPPNQREVLLLRYYSGLKFHEIAQLLGCPLNTALGRAHKALLKMRQLLME